jgi:hypothetical protein
MVCQLEDNYQLFLYNFLSYTLFLLLTKEKGRELVISRYSP